MSIKDTTNPRSGGSVSVNGMSIAVPDNLLVGFPATFVPFAEVAAAFPGFGGDDGPAEVSVSLSQPQVQDSKSQSDHLAPDSRKCRERCSDRGNTRYSFPDRTDIPRRD